MTEQTTVTINPTQGAPDALLVHYGGQFQQQGCFIGLDLRTGSMWADFNAEIGNAVPSDVWHGLVERYPIPVVQPATANALMEEIKPLAQRVVNGTEIVWDGSNHVARQSTDAQLSSESIYEFLQSTESDVHVWEAADWCDPIRSELMERFANGETVETIATELQGDGSDEGTPIVDGLDDYLTAMRAEAIKETI